MNNSNKEYKNLIREKFCIALDKLGKTNKDLINDKLWTVKLKLPRHQATLRKWKEDGPTLIYKWKKDRNSSEIVEIDVLEHLSIYFKIDFEYLSNAEITTSQFIDMLNKKMNVKRQVNLKSQKAIKEKVTVFKFLENIENSHKYMKPLRLNHKIALTNQYIPIEVTLIRKKRYENKNSFVCYENEEELKRIYAFKCFDNDIDDLIEEQSPWDKVREQYRTIMVLADPGIGKTTLLKRELLLAVQKAKQIISNNQNGLDSVILPIYIKLYDLDQQGDEVFDAVLELIIRDYPKTSKPILQLLKKKLNSGKCVLLLDSLDEVPIERRRSLSDKLNRFSRNYNCPMTCTSRIVGYGGDFLNFAKEVEIIPFRKIQIKEYVKLWFTNIDSNNNNDILSASNFLKELKNKPQITGLIQIPLLLSLLCSLYRERNLPLPTRRHLIIKEALNFMIDNWSKQKKPKSGWKLIPKLKLLEELAYHFTCKGQQFFLAQEVYDWIDNYLKRDDIPSDFKYIYPSKLLEELTEDDGILLELNKTNKELIFFHRTFQEFLTASYINNIFKLNIKIGLDIIKKYLWNFEWHEIIILLSGILDNPHPLIHIIANTRDDIFRSLLLLAGRCITECLNMHHNLYNEILENIYSLWKRYPSEKYICQVLIEICHINKNMYNKVTDNIFEDYQLQITVFKVLKEARDINATFTTLIKAIESENIHARYEAVKVLGKIGDKRATNYLIKIIEKEKRPDIRFNAASSLAKIRDPNAADVLVNLFYRERITTKSRIAKLILEIDKDKGIDILNSALLSNDYRNRFASAMVMYEIGDEKGIYNLIQLIRSKSIPPKYGTIISLDRIKSNEIAKLLILAIYHYDHRIIQAAALELSNFSDPNIINAIIDLLEQSNDITLHFHYSVVLGYTGNQKAIKYAIHKLQNGTKNEIQCASELLHRLGGLKAEKALISALNDKYIEALDDEFHNVRRSIILTLGHIGCKKSAIALSKIIQNENFDLILSAITALGYLNHPIATNALLKAYYNDKIEYKDSIISSLSSKKDKRIIKPMLQFLEKTDDSDTIRYINRFLIRIGTIQILEKLIKTPTINIFQPMLYSLTRLLMLKNRNEKTSLIPIYLETVKKFKSN